VNIDSTRADGSDGSLPDRGEDVITDSKGRVTFRNLPRGTYKLTAKPLLENAGWFSGTEMELVLDKTREIEIPFSHGVRVIGFIGVDHSVFSNVRNKTPELSRIRVTAVDSSGKAYSCLTGVDGKFELYVPAGDYRISINQKALGDDYLLDQNSIPISLMGGMDAYNISFHMKERERQVKVKKFGKDGEEIK